MTNDEKPLHELLADAPEDKPISDDPLVERLVRIVGRQQTEIEQLREAAEAVAQSPDVPPVQRDILRQALGAHK